MYNWEKVIKIYSLVVITSQNESQQVALKHWISQFTEKRIGGNITMLIHHKKVNFWSWQQNMVHSAGAKLLKLYSYYWPTFTGPKLSQIWAKLNPEEDYVDT